jgi:deoxyribodipyrimidine photo-lyase
VPFHEVDAHNIVPVWVASDKREVGARTLRPKIHRNLAEYCVEFPPIPDNLTPWQSSCPLQPTKIDWDSLLNETLLKGSDVPEVTWCLPGK